MHDAYAWLRTLEHRIQLYRLRRTHVVPERRGRRCAGWAGRWATSRTRSSRWRRSWAHHRREVRRLHEKLFYRPLLAAVARIPGEEARLSPEAAECAAGRARATPTRRPRCATSRR